MKIIKFFLSIALLVIVTNICNSQGIKRRAYLGVYGDKITDSLAAVYNISSGIYIDSIKSTVLQKEHKLRPSDIILSINGIDVKTMRDLRQQVSSGREGDKINFRIIRKGKEMVINGVYPAFPYEKSDSHEIIYDEFDFDKGQLRVIIDKPKKQGKLPAILFVQGYTCGSLDIVNSKHPYIQLVKGLCKKGYVVMRMEKPGVGDCNNSTKCRDLDFHNEVKAFEEGLRKLKSYDFVDTTEVFIWGHSLGGIIAPIIADREKVKGIIVYGTTIKPWREYLIEMFRFQNPLFGADYVEHEAVMKDVYRLMYSLFIEKKKPSEIQQNDTALSRILKEQLMHDSEERLWGRNYNAFVQIDDYNLAKYWSKTDAKVLVFWADADIEAFSKYDHETIVDVVNHYHTGNATFNLLKNTTHAFAKVESMRHGIENRSWKYITENFNIEVVLKTDEWINKVLENH